MIVQFPDVVISRSGSVRVITEDALFWLRWNTDIRANDPGFYALDHTITDAMAVEGFIVRDQIRMASPERRRDDISTNP